MKSKKYTGQYIFYLLMLLGCGAFIWWMIRLGESLHAGNEAVAAVSGTGGMSGAFGIFKQTVEEHFVSNTGRLLLQIVVILTAARLVGWIFNKIGQPTVIGEILAGIMLGPSLLGQVAPEAFNWLFPHESLGFIHLLSQFGLILFMFAIGMELSLSDIKAKARQSIIISHAGILFPFLLGILLSYYTFSSYAAEHTSFLPYALFVGVAMSITAFPVLARIIQERRMGQSHLGKLALSSAAAGDITAWLVLAAVMAVTTGGSMTSAVYNLAFLLLYMLLMFGVLRPVFRIVAKLYDNLEVVSKTMVGFVFILLLLSSLVTEVLSMHALFGAFIMGLVMPEDLKFRKIMTEKVEDVALTLFLPLFFVSSGLETRLGLINTSSLWWLFGIVTLVAIIGKVGGTYISARATGETRRDSLYLGAFMNTRGLMELVVLAIGFDLGILPPVIFTILVLMTLVTTFMTTPLISFIDLFFRRQPRHPAQRLQVNGLQPTMRVLISFGRASSGSLLLRLADRLLSRGTECRPAVTALHITPNTDTNPIFADNYAKDCFAPLLRSNEEICLDLDTRYELADNPEQLILDTVREGNYTLLLVGGGIRLSNRPSDQAVMAERKSLRRRLGALTVATTQTLMSGSALLRDKMHYFAAHASCSVGIFIDRHFVTPKAILVFIDCEADLRLLPYAHTLAENNGGSVSILPSATFRPSSVKKLHPEDNLLLSSAGNPGEIFSQHDFLIIGYESWTQLTANDVDAVQEIPSTLIMQLR